MTEYNYSFDEVTLLANKNMNLINNVLKLEKIKLLKTVVNGANNENVLTIFDINEVLIEESKRRLGIDSDAIFTKENLNEVLSIMNFDSVIHSESVMNF